MPVIGSIPKGICVMWLGKKADIPKGWLACDGQNKTLDLRSDAGRIGITAFIVKV